MIKVNLMPGGRKQTRSRSGVSLRLPKIGGAGLRADRWALATFLVPVVALAAVGWMYLSTTSEQEELDVALEAAVQDSVRFSDIAEKTPHDKEFKEDQPPCNYAACKGLELLVRHFAGCKLRAPGKCIHCKRMWQLLELHSRLCADSDVCRVPLCR